MNATLRLEITYDNDNNYSIYCHETDGRFTPGDEPSGTMATVGFEIQLPEITTRLMKVTVPQEAVTVEPPKVTLV